VAANLGRKKREQNNAKCACHESDNSESIRQSEQQVTRKIGDFQKKCTPPK
jgi:hypothetical protein